MKPTELVTGLPGHPTHPPLTDGRDGRWLGGTVVYVHGMRVLKLVDEPALGLTRY